MALREVVSLYVGGDSGRRLVYTEAAAPVAQALPDSVPVEQARDGEAVVRVDLAPTGAAKDVAQGLLSALGDRDVAVLLLVCVPEDVPVGPLVELVTRAGARIVRVEGVRTRHARTAVVLTRDPSLPVVSYLLGHEVPQDEAAQRRLSNEWQLEGAQLRALAATLERRLEGALAESAALRVEKAAVESRLAGQGRQHAKEIAAMERRLAAGGQGLGPRLRRAARTVSADPVGGSKKVAKAVVRRASR